MKCPFELPVEVQKVLSSDEDYDIENNDCIIAQKLAKEDADYIAQAINSHEKLAKALRRYGHHDSPCAGILDLNDDAECTCGFGQVLKKAEKKQ